MSTELHNMYLLGVAFLLGKIHLRFICVVAPFLKLAPLSPLFLFHRMLLCYYIAQIVPALVLRAIAG